MDEETENLLRRAKKLVNNEFRSAASSDEYKENDIPCSQPPNKLLLGNHLRPAQSIKDARLKIRQEWEALKNSTISPVNDPVTEKAKEVRKKDAQNDILYGVVVYVEIKSSEKHVAGVKYILKSLGATVKDKFANEVTHVVFKNGSMETYKRAKLLNVHLVSVLWIDACRNSKTKVCERLFPVVDTNDYTNSPRVFRRFMEYQSKFYEYDESTGGIVRKSSKNQHQALTTCLQNLTITNQSNSKNTNNPISTNASSNESLTLCLSDEADNLHNRSKETVNLHNEDNPIEKCNDKANTNTLIKRKLYAKRPMEQSFSALSQGERLSGKQSQKPSLINPYEKPTNNTKALKKVLPPNNKPAFKISHKKSPPKKQKVDNSQKSVKDSHVETCHGIINFHDVYKRTHQMFRPPSKYDHTDHRKCPSLVSTSLHSSENASLKRVVSSLGGFHFKAKVDKSTTHLVCGEPRRTINLLKAVAHGCWVLHLQWVEKSAEAGRWLGEEQFELTEFSKIVQRSRIQKQTFGDYYSLDIFDECGLIYVSDKCSPPRRDLMELIVLCGGKVTSNIPLAKIVIGEEIQSSPHCVSEKWVLDSITLGRYKTIEKYHLKVLRGIL